MNNATPAVLLIVIYNNPGSTTAKSNEWKIPLCFTKIDNNLGSIGILLLILLFGESMSGKIEPTRTKAKKTILLPVETKGISISANNTPKAKWVFASIY